MGTVTQTENPIISESLTPKSVTESPTALAVMPIYVTDGSIFTVQDLTSTQMERYDALSSFYDDASSLKIVSCITSHGHNAWPNVISKVMRIANPKEVAEEYLTVLAEDISLGHKYTLSEINRAVSRARKSMNLSMYEKEITKNSIADFLSTHMAKAEYSFPTDPKDKPNVIGYTPLVDLNAQN